MPIVTIENVSKTYSGTGTPAVDGISLEIPKGVFFGLLGPNGAGKTTLLSMVSGLRRPDAGTIHVGDFDVVQQPERAQRCLGLVPQDLAIYGALTGRENLAYFGAMQGLRGVALRDRIQSCLDIARLEAVADRRAETYSGGLKRRLNLAIGLLHDPDLLILDEPTVGIDPQSRNYIFESLSELNARGMSLIYTTHYMEEVEQLCDRIAIVDQGKVIAEGTLDTLLSNFSGQSIVARISNDISQEAGRKVQEQLSALPGVQQVGVVGAKIELNCNDADRILEDFFSQVHGAGLVITSLSVGATNLEDLFLNLTGTRLRD